MSDKDDLIYDEDDSVAFIQNYLPQELKGKFSNDDINYIVDLIYEFYESKGFLDDRVCCKECAKRRCRQVLT